MGSSDIPSNGVSSRAIELESAVGKTASLALDSEIGSTIGLSVGGAILVVECFGFSITKKKSAMTQSVRSRMSLHF